MYRSSETIGAIASAMAKAQGELIDKPTRRSKPISCCHRRSRKKPPTSTRPSSCTTWWSQAPRNLWSQSSTAAGKWIELTIEADPIYQTILIAAEKSFWRSVKTGEPPALFDCEPPKPRIEVVRVVDIVIH
jgi:hypothetical protein